MKSSTSKKKLKEFGILFGFGLPILFGLLMPIIWGHSFRLWTLWFGIPVLIISFIRPYLLLYPYRFWMFLGHILGWINSKLILGFVYLTILIPIAFFMKLFGYDPLKTRKNKKKVSYRVINKDRIIDLERVF